MSAAAGPRRASLERTGAGIQVSRVGAHLYSDANVNRKTPPSALCFGAYRLPGASAGAGQGSSGGLGSRRGLGPHPEQGLVGDGEQIRRGLAACERRLAQLLDGFGTDHREALEALPCRLAETERPRPSRLPSSRRAPCVCRGRAPPFLRLLARAAPASCGSSGPGPVPSSTPARPRSSPTRRTSPA